MNVQFILTNDIASPAFSCSPLQLLNETFAYCNFTWIQGYSPGTYEISAIGFVDYLYPFTQRLNFTQLVSLGIEPYLTSISDNGTPILESVKLLTSTGK